MLLRAKIGAHTALYVVLLLCSIIVCVESGLRCRPEAQTECKERNNTNGNYYYFKVGGENNSKFLVDPVKFELTCPENIKLESEFLPTFDRLETFSNVYLSNCSLPSSNYKETLLSLNISVRSTLELTIRGESKLEAKLFKYLNISELSIKGKEGGSTRAEPEFLSPLSELTHLYLTRVALTPDAVLHLPRALSLLKLEETGVETLPAEAFARLHGLRTLFLNESRLTSLDLSAAGRLKNTEILAPLDGLTLGPALQSLSLLDLPGLELRGSCTGLREVFVNGGGAALPEGWLRNCFAVEKVQVHNLREYRAAGEWRGAGSVRYLNLRYCKVRNLPHDWLEDAVNLEVLDLSYNSIEQLPLGLFSRTTRLQRLDLSRNRLRIEAMPALSSLKDLLSLALEENPLGDLCRAKTDIRVNGDSPLHLLKALKTLSLRGTNVTTLCQDWRLELKNLTELDLRDNNITELRYKDSRWVRAEGVNVIVDMRGSAVESLVYREQDYRAALDADKSALAVLDANWALSCDCSQYWVGRALRERPEHASAFRSARCSAGQALRDWPLREFKCELPENCSTGCACVASPVHTEISCVGAHLRELPVPPAAGLPPVTELRVPDNNITALRPADLAPYVNATILDFSNNSISVIDAETVAALFVEGRWVSLAGNPLRCDCDAFALLKAVAEWPSRVDELASCADGTALLVAAERASIACAPLPAWPVGVVTALLLLLLPAALVAAVLARPPVRARIKLFLFERGLCLRWLLRAEPDEDGSRPYDAFVSFSHRDAAFAAELAVRLEGAGRRLCLHERDWTPGEWIPTQIARSVRDARRTVVLVSENFLSSEWARAELREAYGAALGEARPRLLVVLLPGCAAAAAAAAAPELRAYLAAVTYLSWEDPRFWSRLHMALPPRAPETAPPPAQAVPHHKPTAAAA